MKTFLDTHKEHSRSFILYGNLNDTIWCGDLVVRNSEQFLVKLLRSRGYRHIIFYGDAGTKGAYCLDPDSARFFFQENGSLPPASPPGQRGNAPPEQGEPRHKHAPGAELVGMVHRHRYRPGDLSRKNARDTAPDGAAKQNEPAPSAPPRPESGGPPSSVRYSFRQMTLENFVLMISPKMLNPDSDMAVIFYNLFTSDIGRVPSLRDNILHIWELVRDTDGVYNICLMMAPDTSVSVDPLIRQIQASGLASKFLLTDADERLILNAQTCFPLGLPEEDEIRNLLRRLSIVGTGVRHRKITFHYEELPDIIAEILYCSRSCGKGEAEQPEYMRQICGRIQDYVEGCPGTEPVAITTGVVCSIWERPQRDRTPALEKLHREGWEKAFQVVSHAVSECEAYRSGGEERLPRKAVDWAVQRFSTAPARRSPRPPIPNFVLTGNPGVGKTTIARLIGDVLREHGILKIGSTVEVTRENLTSSYVAGVPKATMNCVNRAEEGVLFIDEAHALGRKDGGADHDGTGKEVVSTLNSAMTDPQRHFSVILAGYEEEMRAVFKLDDGFARRFGENRWIVIEDYRPELLEKILKDFIRGQRYTLSPELTDECQFEGVSASPLRCYVSRVYQERDRARFGNAGAMQHIALSACANAHGGVVTEDCFYTDTVNHEWFQPARTGSSLNQILQDIRFRFVGMEQIEQYFVSKSRQIEEVLHSGGNVEAIPLRPILLVGNPGTGKTSVATMLARLYYHFHLLGTPEAILISGSTLASTLSGGTQEKVLGYVKDAQARKGLLFVDEAHQLIDGHFDGAGALRAFLSPLTDREHPFMAVFAVYPSMLERFFALDPGVSRRFEVIRLHDYTGEQLYAIAQKMMENHVPPVTADPETMKLLRRVCEYLYVTRTDQTGNAGRIERLLEEMNDRRRARYEEPGTPDYYVFRREDIPEDLLSALPPERASAKELMAELNALCGLREIKEHVADIIRMAATNRTRKARGLPVPPMSLHMAFKGNPGTGKTTVARLIGRLFQSIGVLPRGHLEEVGREGLVAGYVGQTALKTQEVINRALGGVLFVDEAYTLHTEEQRDFGQEAIDTILKNMEDHREELVVIVAGYSEPMERFLSSNPGLRSRFRNILTFHDYTLEELCEILDSFCRKYRYHMTPEARESAKHYIRARLASSGENFSNGRFVRNLFETITNNLANRIYHLETPTGEELSLIIADDIPRLEEPPGKRRPN